VKKETGLTPALFCVALLILIATWGLIPREAAAGKDVQIVFLHHSTGAGVYGKGGVAQWINEYNSSHGTHITITERSYPNKPYPWKNYPYDYWNLWINGQCSSQPGVECLSSLAKKYDIIIFKHCFPGAAIRADGKTAISSDVKTLTNYKAQYRALRNLMDGYKATQFVFWTLAPLHRNATNPADAARAKQFVDWVTRDFLAEDGKSHPNIHIFDFWSIVAEGSTSSGQGQVNTLKYAYEKDHNGKDSHPNDAANRAAGQQFAKFIVALAR